MIWLLTGGLLSHWLPGLKAHHRADKDWLYIKDDIRASQGQENVTKCCAGISEIIVGMSNDPSASAPTGNHQGPAVALGQDCSKSGDRKQPLTVDSRH